MTTRLVNTTHRAPYPAISPAAPQNSQQGRNILITGASDGIGFHAARAFVAAGAARVIITGRRQAMIDSAIEQLQSTRPAGSKTLLLGRSCDVGSEEQMLGMWEGLARDGITVDVLILNAGMIVNCGLLSTGFEQARQMYQVNVIANLQIADSFIKQGAQSDKTLLYITSVESHLLPAPGHAGYAATKLAASAMFQELATEYPAEQLTVINVHPGAVFTEPVRRHGLTESSFPWDSPEVPAGFMVWACTRQARFLHGRLVHATWDVEELMALDAKLQAEQGLLKFGVLGTEPMSFGEYVKAVMDREAQAGN